MPARILIVDDILPKLKLLEAKLVGEYYEVIVAQNGVDALARVRDDSPDIILLDVLMPEMDGFAVCRAVRSDPASMHIPVVMLTALSDAADRVRGLEAGADDFLTKPVSDIALFARVRSLLRMKLAMDDLRQRSIARERIGIIDPMPAPGGESFEDARIVVLDDNMADLDHIVHALSYEHDRVLKATRMSDALHLAQDSDVDMVIISLTLQHEDGLRLCSQLRSNERTRHLPVLLLDQDGSLERIAKGLELGANDYAAKPIDRNELLCRVRTQVRRRRYQERLRLNYEQSLSMALTDSLTGVFNRRYANMHLPRLLDHARNDTRPLVVLMLDMDHFKMINDRYGHGAGDEVLCEVTRRITRLLPGSGLLARMGGEEFLVAVTGIDQDSALDLAEQLRQSVAVIPIAILAGAVQLAATMSIGLAISIPDDTVESLLRRADMALYQAKRAGRNCIIDAVAAD